MFPVLINYLCSLAGLASIFYIVVVIVGYYIWGKEKESFDVIYAQVNSKVFDVLPLFVFAYTCHQNVLACFCSVIETARFLQFTVSLDGTGLKRELQ